MPFESATDQAAGLRRLVPTPRASGWCLMGARPGTGVTTLVIHLARTLARQGLQVLVLDQHVSPRNVGNRMDLRPRHDLLDVVHGDCHLSQVLLSTRQGVDVLPMARAARQALHLSSAPRQRLQGQLQTLLPYYDMVLTDALPEVTPLAGQRPLLVLDASPEGLKQGYAQIKHWVRGTAGAQPLELVLTRTRDVVQGQILFDNLARSTQHFLNFTPKYLGQFPLEPGWSTAVQGIESPLGAPGATALTHLARVMRAPPEWEQTPQELPAGWRRTG